MIASSRSRLAMVLASLVVLTVGVYAALASKPEKAKACPACLIIAGVGAEELIGTGIIAGAAVGIGTQLGHIHSNAQDRAIAIHRPGGASWERFMRKVRHRRGLGHAVWRKANKSLSGLARWFRNHVGSIRIKRHWPTGAWYCLISATGSYLANGSLRDAAFACIGGFLAGITTPPSGRAPVPAVSAPLWYDSAMQAEVATTVGEPAPWSSMVPDDSAEWVPAWVTALETP